MNNSPADNSTVTVSESDQPVAVDETAASRATDCYTEIVSLARSAPSTHAYFAGVLQIIARSIRSPYAALYLRMPSEVIQDDWHDDSADWTFWKSQLQSFLTDSLAERGTRARVLRAREGGDRIAFAAAPVCDRGNVEIGAVALVFAPFEDENVAVKLSWLESLTRLASHAAGFLGASSSEADRPAGAAPSRALAKAATFNTPTELAFSITDSLRNKLGCTQVALGMVTRRRVKILSISGLDHVAKQGDGVACLQAAMEECYDAKRTLVFQHGEDWSAEGTASGYRLHAQWSAATKGDVVASIPLEVDEQVVAVLSLRRTADEPFTAEHVDAIRSNVEPFAPALVMARRATRGMARHAGDKVHEAVGVLVGPGRRGTKVLAALIVLATAWFAGGTMEYELTVPCSVAPALVRHVTVPFDGVLLAAGALEGDRVSKGDVLCEIDCRDLEQDRAELLAEIAVLEHEKDRAMAGSMPVETQLALARQRLAQAKLAIVNLRIERACVRSPIDGVIATGDLRKRVGAVVGRGEPLFAIAPLDKWTLEMHVPEPDADELREGLVGEFVPHARPEESRAFRVSRVRPQAEVQNQQNVVVAEADTELPYAWMRPGMEGVAKVKAGRRRVWWVALHRAIEYVQLNLWP